VFRLHVRGVQERNLGRYRTYRNPNAPIDDVRTPLSAACEWWQPGVVERLLEKGADAKAYANRESPLGWTLLGFYRDRGLPDEQCEIEERAAIRCAELLLQRGGFVPTDMFGSTTLASLTRISAYRQQTLIELADLLLAHGDDVNREYIEQRTATRQYVEVLFAPDEVSVWVKYTALISAIDYIGLNFTSKSKNSKIHIANSIALMQFLITRGADVTGKREVYRAPTCPSSDLVRSVSLVELAETYKERAETEDQRKMIERVVEILRGAGAGVRELPQAAGRSAGFDKTTVRETFRRHMEDPQLRRGALERMEREQNHLLISCLALIEPYGEKVATSVAVHLTLVHSFYSGRTNYVGPEEVSRTMRRVEPLFSAAFSGPDSFNALPSELTEKQPWLVLLVGRSLLDNHKRGELPREALKTALLIVLFAVAVLEESVRV
jgi:hypothetical protein